MNPVLREGNSDRRAAIAVKKYAQANPHSMGDWSADSKTHVSLDGRRRFPLEREVRRRWTRPAPARPASCSTAADGTETVLKDGVTLPAGTVVDATFMCAEALDAFLARPDREDRRTTACCSRCT